MLSSGQFIYRMAVEVVVFMVLRLASVGMMCKYLLVKCDDILLLGVITGQTQGQVIRLGARIDEIANG